MNNNEELCPMCNKMHVQLNMFKYNSVYLCNKCYPIFTRAIECGKCTYLDPSRDLCKLCEFVPFHKQDYQFKRTISANSIRSGKMVSVCDL